MAKKILVVEDDSDTAFLLQSFLKRQGYGITTARDGQEALTCLEQDQFDLVLMDVEMPSLNGLEALRQMRANPATAELPVILLTARKSLSDIAAGYRAGSDYYMSKPFLPGDVIQFVRAIFEDETHASE